MPIEELYSVLASAQRESTSRMLTLKVGMQGDLESSALPQLPFPKNIPATHLSVALGPHLQSDLIKSLVNFRLQEMLPGSKNFPKESPGQKDRPLVVRRVTAMARQCVGDSLVRKLVLSGSGMESGFSMIQSFLANQKEHKKKFFI